LNEVFERLRLTVFERGWLSSNNVLFSGGGADATLVDSGYATHAQQTVTLLESALGSTPLEHVVNTHLHSDHCGGNAALHARWRCRIAVPQAAFQAASDWDEHRLTFVATGQHCERFAVHTALRPGTLVELGPSRWEIHSAPGHDPDALMLYQQDEGVLISGDALWERGVAILFPELLGASGFGPALQALDDIEALAPRVVIPGHGPPFTAVAQALEDARARIYAFARDPEKHRMYAARALLMFHMLEHRQQRRDDLIAWAMSTAMLARIAPGEQRGAKLREALDRLVADGSLEENGGCLVVPANRR
jgi:glyoxylase-like metal-dependent hydrolase (beta-lactamase superfamily II)